MRSQRPNQRPTSALRPTGPRTSNRSVHGEPLSATGRVRVLSCPVCLGRSVVVVSTVRAAAVAMRALRFGLRAAVAWAVRARPTLASSVPGQRGADGHLEPHCAIRHGVRVDG